ncbi:hypothetical protein JVX98_25210 [Ensifer sp. PDNC004]|uniref:hypothetical protein n=1 Tax=Ensifer sp. PDNC004 TaxID=2811423 RepID=UPI001964C43C|nr:hypothetical protein [Ensifer sp. PDNC004]QRY67621.1 hypothetical protein JVX98_25210 [Ensifer sp. PDNC004]
MGKTDLFHEALVVPEEVFFVHDALLAPMTERRYLDLEGFAYPDGHTSKGIEAHIEELKPMFVFASSSIRAGIALSAPASSGNAGPAPPLITLPSRPRLKALFSCPIPPVSRAECSLTR